VDDTEKIKQMLRMIGTQQGSHQLLHSGSTLVDLACTGTIEGAFLAGHYYFVVGDSNSGKTWLGLSCFAEAATDPQWDNYRLVYDPVEGGALMDLERFFGRKAAERIEVVDPPSETVEEFYYNLDDQLSGDRPVISVLDSQDALSSVAEQEKFEKTKKAYRSGKSTSGSFGDNKAKVHSANLRKFMGPLRDTGSILLILNQTRDSFDLFTPKTYSGGRALKFYATIQLWNKVKKNLIKSVRGKKRQLGVLVELRAKKSRATGRDRVVEIPIYHSYGIDDVGSCVDYLVSEGVWSKGSTGYIQATGIGPTFKGYRDKIIDIIEQEDKIDDLRLLVERTWREIEKECEIRRRPRYE